MAVLREEEQGTQTDLLDIKAHEEMLNGLREEEPTSIAGAGLVIDPSEEILVKEIE
jgi:hypothetical protein